MLCTPIAPSFKLRDMNTWTPLIAAIVITVILNAFPLIMAFVLRVEGWAQAGWALYFFIVPFSLILLLIGLITSLYLFFTR